MANTTGRKFGGRKKGTPNKNTQKFEEFLDNFKHNPAEKLVHAAEEAEKQYFSATEYEEKRDWFKMYVQINTKLMDKLVPDRKAVEMSASVEYAEPPQFVVPSGVPEFEEWQKKNNDTAKK